MAEPNPTSTWHPDSGGTGSTAQLQSVPAVGRTLGGRFLLVRLLGAGGAGVVFEAQDTAVGETVALKILRPDVTDARSRERLRREVRAARPGHPNSVTVHDLHELDGFLALSMELVEGEGLAQILDRQGTLPVGEAAATCRQIAAALAYFHARRLVHRDVKPSNVLRRRDGVIKLCDLGLMRPVAHGLTVTQTAMVVGTPAYMAPEQATARELTAATDVYALGLTLWECVTGRVPLRGATAVETLVQRQRQRPPRLRSLRPDAPRWLDRLLARMLDPDPRKRPAAAEVERALETGRVRRQPPWRLLGAAALAAVAAAGGVQAWRLVRAPATVRMDAADREVRGFDARGRVTWTIGLANPVTQVVRADLDGDGREDLLVADSPQDRGGVRNDQLAGSEFLAVTPDGRIITRVSPEALIRVWYHPFSKRLRPYIRVTDVDGDGRPDVVLNCPHQVFYPDEVLVYLSDSGTWSWILDHSGTVFDVSAVPGHPGQLALAAVNNSLGMLPVAGLLQIDLHRLQEGSATGEQPLASPDSVLASGPLGAWLRYTPLPADLLRDRIYSGFHVEPHRDGDLDVVYGTSRWRVDVYGNPADGPNAGLDLGRLRMSFMERRAALDGDSPPMEDTAVRTAWSAFRTDMAPLLQEAPYAVITKISQARSLARAGDRVGAEQALAGGPPSEEATVLLANLEALTGQRRAAWKRMWDLAGHGFTARATYEAPRLLVDLAIERHGDAAMSEAFGRWKFVQAQTGLIPALWAKAHLWWDQLTPADTTVQSWPMFQEGSAIACLARWRLGSMTAADVADMKGYVASDTDGQGFARLALATALVSRGDVPAALSELDNLVVDLNRASADDFSSWQLLLLAKGVQAKALAEAGQLERTRRVAREVLSASDPHLLPAVLAREALAAAAGAPPRR